MHALEERGPQARAPQAADVVCFQGRFAPSRVFTNLTRFRPRELPGNSPRRAPSCAPRPRTPTAAAGAAPPPPPRPQPGPRRPRAPPASARRKRRGRRRPHPSSHRPPLTCPARACRERTTSTSTSWERLGLQLCSRLPSPTHGRLCSAAAAMTPRRPPELRESAPDPTPPRFCFRRLAMTSKHSVLGRAGLGRACLCL